MSSDIGWFNVERTSKRLGNRWYWDVKVSNDPFPTHIGGWAWTRRGAHRQATAAYRAQLIGGHTFVAG